MVSTILQDMSSSMGRMTSHIRNGKVEMFETINIYCNGSPISQETHLTLQALNVIPKQVAGPVYALLLPGNGSA